MMFEWFEGGPVLSAARLRIFSRAALGQKCICPRLKCRGLGAGDHGHGEAHERRRQMGQAFQPAHPPPALETEAQRVGKQSPEKTNPVKVFRHQPRDPIGTCLLFAPQGVGEIGSLRLRQRLQIFHQHMHNGLPDHLPLLVFQKLARGGVSFVNMRSIFGDHDAPGVEFVGKEIGADNRLDETVVNAKFLRQIKPARDLGPDAIKLAGHLPVSRAVHFGSGQRDAIAPGFQRLERHVLDGLVTGDLASEFSSSARYMLNNVSRRLKRMSESMRNRNSASGRDRPWTKAFQV